MQQDIHTEFRRLREELAEAWAVALQRHRGLSSQAVGCSRWQAWMEEVFDEAVLQLNRKIISYNIMCPSHCQCMGFLRDYELDKVGTCTAVGYASTERLVGGTVQYSRLA